MEGIQLGLQRIKFPKIIEFQTQTLCNGRCTICPYEQVKKIIPYFRMSDEKVNLLIKELAEHKEDIERVVPYLNNEPFLDKRCISILRRLKKNHFIELSTNASLLSKEVAETIVNEKLVDDFRISFFGGTKESYSRLMRGLQFEKVVENIQYFLAINRRNINTQMTMILLPWLDMKKSIEEVKNLFPNENIVTFGYLDRAGNNKIFRNNLCMYEKDKIKLCGCNLERPFERMCIMSNGNVILCSQDWKNEIVQGNIFETSISEVWNSNESINIKKMVKGEVESSDNFLCKRCKLAKIKVEDRMVLNFAGDKYMDEWDRKRYEYKD